MASLLLSLIICYNWLELMKHHLPCICWENSSIFIQLWPDQYISSMVFRSRLTDISIVEILKWLVWWQHVRGFMALNQTPFLSLATLPPSNGLWLIVTAARWFIGRCFIQFKGQYVVGGGVCACVLLHIS